MGRELDSGKGNKNIYSKINTRPVRRVRGTGRTRLREHTASIRVPHTYSMKEKTTRKKVLWRSSRYTLRARRTMKFTR